MRKFVSVGATLCLLSACASATRYLHSGIGPMTDPVGTHSQSVQRADVIAVDLKMRDGSARIIATQSDSITAKVELTRHSDSDYRNQCTPSIVEAAGVSMRRVAATLDIRIESKDKLRCAEHWTIMVPAGISVVATADVANLSIAGIQADVIGTVDVGKITITDAGSSAIARVRSVGDASVESTTSSYAEAVASADVGKTDLTIDGARVDVKRSPGPGGRIGLKGNGKDRVIAETGVGDAKVTLTRKTASN